jgi:tRNA 5-methylaminomethyl-2-thiouridine biosynthesis bifunctional protein
MADGAEFVKEEVISLVYDDGFWLINDTYKAKDVLLATGAYKSVIAEEYIGIRGIWGHRINIKTSTKNEYALHQDISISPSVDGVLAIGATHDVHYHPQTTKEPYDMQKGREELIETALKSIELKDIQVIKDFTGLRSGSSDYMPIVGRVVDSMESLKTCKQNINKKKPDYEEFTYYPNLYMLNGNGGYGFVLAPYIAKMLSEVILKEKKIDDRLSPARFFVRWARRLPSSFPT